MKTLSLIILICMVAVTVYADPIFTRDITTTVKSVTTTGYKAPLTALKGRKYIEIQNVGSTTIYLGGSTVTADEASTGGIQLLANASWCQPYSHNVDIYAISASSGTILIEEGK